MPYFSIDESNFLGDSGHVSHEFPQNSEEISSNSSESWIENIDSSKSTEEIDVGSAESVQSGQPIKIEEISRVQQNLPEEPVGSNWSQINTSFLAMITDTCGKDLFKIVEWMKNNPLFGAHSNESKVNLTLTISGLDIIYAVGLAVG